MDHVVCPAHIHHQGTFEISKEILDGLVVLQGYPLSAEVFLDLGAHLVGVDEEDTFILRHNDITYEDGVAVNVRTTQVQQPGHLVQLAYHQGFTDVFLHVPAYQGNLVLGLHTRQFQRLYFHRVVGNGRTVFPQDLSRVTVRMGVYPVSFQLLGHRVHAFCAVHPAIHTHVGLLVKRLDEPFCRGGCVGKSLLHELEGRTLQLFRCGEEITRVRPQGGTRQGHYGGACRPVEAAYPFACLPVVGDVFSAVRVCAGEDEGFQATLLHPFSQSFYSLGDGLVHDDVDFWGDYGGWFPLLSFFSFFLLIHLEVYLCGFVFVERHEVLLCLP